MIKLFNFDLWEEFDNYRKRQILRNNQGPNSRVGLQSFLHSWLSINKINRLYQKIINKRLHKKTHNSILTEYLFPVKQKSLGIPQLKNWYCQDLKSVQQNISNCVNKFSALIHILFSQPHELTDRSYLVLCGLDLLILLCVVSFHDISNHGSPQFPARCSA